MADPNRMVFPEEVEEAKKAAAAAAAAEEQDKTSGGDTNTLDAPPEIGLRNMIQVPTNCPPGYTMGADGVCREVFD